MHLHKLTEEGRDILAENISKFIKVKDIFISGFIAYEQIELDDVGNIISFKR